MEQVKIGNDLFEINTNEKDAIIVQRHFTKYVVRFRNSKPYNTPKTNMAKHCCTVNSVIPK